MTFTFSGADFKTQQDKPKTPSFMDFRSLRNTRVSEVDVAQLQLNEQVRSEFDPDKLAQLAASIEKNGLQQPILVWGPDSAGKFNVICGERRVRACKMLGLAKIPVRVVDKPTDEAHLIRLQIAENFFREDLSALELAAALTRLQSEGGFDNVSKLAQSLGMSERSVYRYLQYAAKLTDEEKQILSELNAPAKFLEQFLSLKRSNLPKALDLLASLKDRQLTIAEAMTALERQASRREKTRTRQQEKKFKQELRNYLSPAAGDPLLERLDCYLKNNGVKLQAVLLDALESYLRDKAEPQ